MPDSQQTPMETATALLAGASGLVGGHCLRLLLDSPDYDRVIVPVRTPLDTAHPKLVQHVVDFDHLNRSARLLTADDVYCCLGTTMKKAGSQEAFRKVDYGYPLLLAQIAAENGAGQFLIVTAIGADPSSRVFYNRVKGETEEAISTYPFRAVHIFRPSMLLGDRKEIRLAERLGGVLMGALGFAFVGKLRKYRAIQSAQVARAMVRTAQQKLTGVHIYESDVIHSISLANEQQ